MENVELSAYNVCQTVWRRSGSASTVPGGLRQGQPSLCSYLAFFFLPFSARNLILPNTVSKVPHCILSKSFAGFCSPSHSVNMAAITQGIDLRSMNRFSDSSSDQLIMAVPTNPYVKRTEEEMVVFSIISH